LGLTFFYEKQIDKLKCFEEMLEKYDVAAENCLYMGDDVIDIPLVMRCGIGVAVNDAVPELIEVADLVTEISGGKGAVRDTLVWLMKAQGTWDDLMLRYYR
jgi:3-deoxy-D-manno-octulosonate 8-phosphate phosphatase (KDO 8-P phosphatase)